MIATLFTIDSDTSGHTVRVRVEGEVDLSVAATFSTQLAEHCVAPGRPVVLDLSALDYADTSALRALVAVTAQARAEQQSLTIASASRPLRRVIELTGLDDVLVIAD
jgi:anti-sigma B factor antagonist